jgi:5'-nucleotidase
MLLLCSNDDGVLARGLSCLERAVRPLGEVFVVAPDREQSATSHSLTLHHPLRPVQLGENRWQVDGTPTDCVMLAIGQLMPSRPDFVLSGVNHGPNMGEDVLYSGTVAAAMEGLALGVPSIAISFAGRETIGAAESLLDEHVEPLSHLLAHLTSLPAFPDHTLFNVNIPGIPAKQIKGVKLTKLGRRTFNDAIAKMKDPWGRPIYWIGGGSVTWAAEEGTDVAAVREGYISVTPLHLDVTFQARLDDAEKWWTAP